MICLAMGCVVAFFLILVSKPSNQSLFCPTVKKGMTFQFGLRRYLIATGVAVVDPESVAGWKTCAQNHRSLVMETLKGAVTAFQSRDISTY
jgi:hypothetical protein